MKKNYLLGCLGLAVIFIVGTIIYAWVNINVIEPAMQRDAQALAAKSKPTPTPTPVDLKTHQGVEAYASTVVGQMETKPYGQFMGGAYTESTKQLQLLFYIPSSMVPDNGHLKNMIETNSYDVEQAIWTSKLKGVVGTVVVHTQGDLVDKYGNNVKGEVGTVTLKADTAKLFNWNNLTFDKAWDNQIYDNQWMLPDVAKS